MSKHKNEEMACGCTVEQETLGSTKWNRIVFCRKHDPSNNAVAVALLGINDELELVKDFNDTVAISREYHAGYLAGLEKAKAFVLRGAR